MKRSPALIIVLIIIGGVLLGGVIASQYTAFTEEKSLSDFGAFPRRQLKDNYQEALLNYFDRENVSEYNARQWTNTILENRPDLRKLENLRSIGIHLLENAPESTGAANVVTAVLWDYRGYDTIGEATVIFVAVAGIAALFRARRREEDEG